MDPFGGSILADDEGRDRLAEAVAISRRVFKHPRGFYLVADPGKRAGEYKGTIRRFESVESARGWAYMLVVGMVDERYSASAKPWILPRDNKLPSHTSPIAQPAPKRRRYLMRAVLGALAVVITVGTLSFVMYYETPTPSTPIPAPPPAQQPIIAAQPSKPTPYTSDVKPRGSYCAGHTADSAERIEFCAKLLREAISNNCASPSTSPICATIFDLYGR